MNAPRLSHPRARGVSLIFALLALAAMSLAAVALVRSVHGGSLVIGNVGFKQDTTRAADRAAEIARGWLASPGNDLAADGATGTGYYAQARTNIDPTGQRTSSTRRMEVIDWEGVNHGSCAGNTCSGRLTPSNEVTLASGVRAQYLITRLCPNTGAVDNAANACAQPVTLIADPCLANGGSNHNEGCVSTPPQQAPYYRIIVRTVGGRNTVSYTETIVH